MKQGSTRIIKLVVSLCFTIMVMVIIFLLSAQNSNDSGSLSESIARILAQAFIPGFDDLSYAEQHYWVDALGFPVRKAAHATEYAVLGISLVLSCWQIYAIRIDKNGSTQSLLHNVVTVSLAAVIIGFLYACSDEIHQLFIDGRAGQILDVCIDTCGVAIGCVLCSAVMYMVLNRKNKRKA